MFGPQRQRNKHLGHTPLTQGALQLHDRKGPGEDLHTLNSIQQRTHPPRESQQRKVLLLGIPMHICRAPATWVLLGPMIAPLLGVEVTGWTCHYPYLFFNTLPLKKRPQMHLDLWLASLDKLLQIESIISQGAWKHPWLQQGGGVHPSRTCPTGGSWCSQPIREFKVCCDLGNSVTECMGQGPKKPWSIISTQTSTTLIVSSSVLERETMYTVDAGENTGEERASVHRG